MSGMVRVLVVDDNADMRDSLRFLLDRCGYDAEAARDGQQALEVHRRRPVEVLLTDIYMPLSDGIEAIQAFRREFPSVKIVAMSGGGTRVRGSYLGVASDIGADATLQKPFEFDALLEALDRLGIRRPG
jgi:CheY-like chemotaxis protein